MFITSHALNKNILKNWLISHLMMVTGHHSLRLDDPQQRLLNVVPVQFNCTQVPPSGHCAVKDTLKLL